MKALAMALASLLPFFVSATKTPSVKGMNQGFVTTEGTHFMLNDRPYYFAGTNVYDFFSFGDGGSTESAEAIEQKFMDKKRIDTHMARLYRDGVRVVRLWGFSHETWHGFEPEPGVYPEAQFMLFDYLLFSANQHGLRLVITLENFWEAYGGIDRRLSWEGLPTGENQRGRFFTSQACNERYKNYIRHFVTRINHYTNISYKDDPTIFAWELMNEPRYRFFGDDISSDVLRRWMDDLGGFIKSLDPNHLVGSGIEGQGSKYGFGSDNGADFVKISQSPYIDFTSAHPYPTEPWAALSVKQTAELIGKWIKDSHEVVKKPLFLGEFNTEKTHGNRDGYWRAIFNLLEESDAGGSGFWWYPDRNVDESRHGVVEGSPELAIFAAHSAVMQQKSEGNLVLPRGSRFNQFSPQDVTVALYPAKGANLIAIRDNEGNLNPQSDYQISGRKILLLKEYLQRQPLGPRLLSMVFSRNETVSHTVTVVDEEPQARLEKSYAESDIAKPQSITLNVDAKENGLENILLGNTALTFGEDFTFDGSKLTFTVDFVRTLTLGVHSLRLDFRFGEDQYLKINAKGSSVIEDFESYANSIEMNRAYRLTPNGNQVSAELVQAGGDQMMEFRYTFDYSTYAGITRQISSSWSAFDGIDVSYTPDQSTRQLVLQLHEQSGEYWEAVVPLDQSGPRVEHIPFSAFHHPPWTNDGNGVVDLNQIVDYSFYLGGDAGTGTIYLNTLKLWKK